jgi:hypothetical protein
MKEFLAGLPFDLVVLGMGVVILSGIVISIVQLIVSYRHYRRTVGRSP